MVIAQPVDSVAEASRRSIASDGTDQATAINSALTALGVLTLPSGTYTLETKLTVPANAVLRGQPDGSTILDWDATSIDGGASPVAIELESGSTLEDIAVTQNGIHTTGQGTGVYIDSASPNVTIRRCVLTGGASGGTQSGSGSNGKDIPISAVGADHLRIEDVEVRYAMRSYGIEINGCENVDLIRLYCHENGYDGLKIHNLARHVRTFQSKFIDNGQALVQLADGNGQGVDCNGYNLTFTDCYASGNGGGFQVKTGDTLGDECSDISFVNCVAYDNKNASGHGFSIAPDDDTPTTACLVHGVKYTNCVSSSNNKAGFHFNTHTASQTGEIHGLVVTNCTSRNNQETGFYVNAGVYGVFVDGLTLFGNSKAGAGSYYSLWFAGGKRIRVNNVYALGVDPWDQSLQDEVEIAAATPRARGIRFERNEGATEGVEAGDIYVANVFSDHHHAVWSDDKDNFVLYNDSGQCSLATFNTGGTTRITIAASVNPQVA